MCERLLITAGLLFLSTFSANAQRLINIDFGAHTNPAFSVKTGTAATGLTPADYWNLYSRDGAYGTFLNESQLLNLKLSDGTLTDADLFVTNAPGAWYTLNTDAMFRSYLYPGSPNIDIHLANVPSGTYDIYVYAHGQPPTENSVIELLSPAIARSSKSTSTDQNWDALGWREGQQFVVFRSVPVQVGERIVLLSKPGAANMAVINGIQLMEVNATNNPNPTITITRQPQNVTAASGSPVEFTVSAVSELPLTYQWEFHSSPIPNSDSHTFRIDHATAADAGNYRVKITNAGQTKYSSEARLDLYQAIDKPLLNIDFGAHLNPYLRSKTGPAAIGKSSTDIWNLYSRDGENGDWLSNNSLSNLRWSDGTPSNIHLAANNAAGAWYTLNDDPMFESYLYPLGRVGNIEAAVTALPTGTYDVYVYAHGQVPHENGVIEVRSGSQSYGSKSTSSAADWDKPGWNEGNEYVVFQNVVVSPGEALRITSKPGVSELAVLNGVQLVLRQGNPEPPSPVVADWTFEEGTPGHLVTGAQDTSGNNNHITEIVGNTAAFIATANGPGLVSVSFPPGNGGFGSGLRSSDTIAFNLGTAFTIETSLKPGSENAVHNRGVLVAQNGRTGRLAYAFDYRSEERRLHFVIVDDTGNGDFVEARIPDDGKSHHVAGVFNNGIMSIYLDKVLTESKPTLFRPAVLPNDPVRVTLGANDIGGYWFHGVIDRVRISRQALPPSEFFPHESGPTNPPGPVVADWTFEEGTPGQLVTGPRDTSGNNNHIIEVVGNTATFIATTNGPGLVSVNFPPGNGGFGTGLRSSDTIDFNLGTAFTIETSLKPGSQNAVHNRGVLVAQNGRTGRLAYAFDYRSEERRLHFVIVDDSGNGDFVEARIPDDGKSHHVAGVFNNGIMSIYLDKVLTESKPTIFRPAVLPNDPVRVTLGANDIGGYWFHGVIDRARISRQALPPSEFFPHESDSSPLVILQPLHDVTVEQGGTATFHVVAAGAAAFNYRWSFNDQVLSNEVSDTLVLINVRPSDAGTYRVTASNGPWEISSSANLTVTGAGTNAPVIQMHPQSRIAGLGTSVQFTVTALSSSPLTYQWFFNGGAIPAGTNAVLWLTTLGETNAGTYHVIVSNSGGSTISRPAVLNLFSSSLSGGELYLDNHTFGVDAPVTDDRGIRLSGHDFLAQLYGSPANQPAFPVGAAVPFGTDENAGYFSDIVSRVIPGTTSGVAAVVEIRAWDARTGRTYEEAAQNGGLHGASLLSVVLGGGNLPPAYLVGMQPFSLVARPRITHQPADLSVTAGHTAVFQVGVSGTPPFTYQWRFNGARMDGETRPSLVISNVSSLHEGDYSVAVINPAGAVTSEAATLTVLPRDTEPPVITLTSPLPGVTTNPRITLAGTATDNVGVTRVEGTRNGQPVGPISLTNGQFTATDIALIVGTNHFAVSAYDLEGNRATTNVSVVLEATRSLWIGLPSPNPIYEGGRIEAPIMVSSSGDIGALSFELTYDTNYLADPELEWRQSLVGVLEQVNTSTPGVVRATYILPGKSIRAGTNMLAVVGFRARSIPQMLETTVGFNLTGIFSATGDAITSGTSVSPRTIELLQRRIKGDNNANHRLDIADATILVRMLTLLDPIRIWDVPANDLNDNNNFDAGDIVRVLRAVVRLDRQPTPAPLQQLSIPAVETAATIQLTADSTLLVPGQQVKVRVLLDGLLDPLSGASFELSYPTNALRLANETSHSAGAVVPQDALTMWNLTPDQDYPTQSGVIHFAAATPIEWSTNSGPIAEFNFTVQPGAADQWTWTLRLSNGEIGVDRDVIALSPSELTLTAREDLRAELSGGAYNSASGQFELRLTGKPGARYKVEFSEDLRTWTEISVVSDAKGNVVLTDTPSTPGARRFYRALELE